MPNKLKRKKGNGKAFDILSIRKTKIVRTFPNSQFYVDGYQLFRGDRVEVAGGIAVFVNEHIVAIQRKVSCKHLEIILLELRIGMRHFALISAHKPTSVNNR